MTLTLKEKRNEINSILNLKTIATIRKGQELFSIQFDEKDSVLFLDLIEKNKNLNLINLTEGTSPTANIAIREGSEAYHFFQNVLDSIKQTNDALVEKTLRFLEAGNSGNLPLDFFETKNEFDFRTVADKMRYLSEYFSHNHANYHVEFSVPHARKSFMEKQKRIFVAGYFRIQLINHFIIDEKKEEHVLSFGFV